jgi:hypothetical protein
VRLAAVLAVDDEPTDADRSEQRLIDLEVGQVLLDVAAVVVAQRDQFVRIVQRVRRVGRVVAERVQRLVMLDYTVSLSVPG